MRTAEVFRTIVERLFEHGVSRRHAELALFSLVNAIREYVLFPEIAGALVRSNRADFAEALAEMFLAHCQSHRV